MGKNSSLTPEELEIHKRAVKLRKMTDSQLVKAFEENKDRSTPNTDIVENILKGLESGECKGIKGYLAQRIRDYVSERGFI